VRLRIRCQIRASRMKEVTLRLTYLGLLAVGVVSLGWVAYTYVDASVFQAHSNWKLNRQIAVAQAAPPPLQRPASQQGSEPAAPPQASSSAEQATSAEIPTKNSPSQANSAVRPAPVPVVGEPMGRMEIKRIGLSAVVLYGDDTKTLRRGVGHVIGTALPGMDGNMALSAHRDTYFRPLRNIRKKDRVMLKTPQRTYEYEVESTMVVKPTQVEVLDPTTEPTLTLITCHPFNYVGSAPNRFIVRARRVSPEGELDSERTRATETDPGAANSSGRPVTSHVPAAAAPTAGTN
jgi:sortase A